MTIEVGKETRSRLKAWCGENSLEYLAYRAEVTAGYIHMLIRGERTPSRKLARKIERITSGMIEWKGWYPNVP
jgi:hypothetical protein